MMMIDYDGGDGDDACFELFRVKILCVRKKILPILVVLFKNHLLSKRMSFLLGYS